MPNIVIAGPRIWPRPITGQIMILRGRTLLCHDLPSEHSAPARYTIRPMSISKLQFAARETSAVRRPIRLPRETIGMLACERHRRRPAAPDRNRHRASTLALGRVVIAKFPISRRYIKAHAQRVSEQPSVLIARHRVSDAVRERLSR